MALNVENKEEKKKNREKLIQKKDPTKVKEELEKYRNLAKRGQLDKGAKDKKAVLEKMYEQVQEYRKASGGSSNCCRFSGD